MIMEQKINIAELLKDCPKGMELDCSIYDNCTFEGIEDVGYINILVKTPSGIIKLPKEGCFVRYDDYAKCVIFPKGKTTWEGFVPPCKFKDGDILTKYKGCICIYKGPMHYNNNLADFYCGYRITDRALVLKDCKNEHFGDIDEYRLATEEEKQKLFDAIKANGYYWNSETKTLERLVEPKFKVGDKVRHKNNHGVVFTITGIGEDAYIRGGATAFGFDVQDNYELVPNKFDITTLKPFDKILVRDIDNAMWIAALFSHLREMRFYTVSTWYNQCIPFEGNQHLLGTTNNCDEFYKTWE